VPPSVPAPGITPSAAYMPPSMAITAAAFRSKNRVAESKGERDRGV
jgi:hypothetical protein